MKSLHSARRNGDLVTSEVHDCVCSGACRSHAVLILDVGVDELKRRLFGELRQIVQAPLGQVVQAYDGVAGMDERV